MKITIEKANGKFPERSKEIKSYFRKEYKEHVIELNYEFKAEPNNGRVQLNLQFKINGINALETYNIDGHVELPYHYPGSFEILNSTGNFISIPHTEGIIIIDLYEKRKTIIKYRSDNYNYSYFYENEFVLIESNNVTIASLTNFNESTIQIENNSLINGIEIRKSDLLVAVYNKEINDIQLLVFTKSDYKKIETINVSKYIMDEEVEKYLNGRKIAKLTFIPNFDFPTIISSWRYIKNLEKNSLIGQIQKWNIPVKKEEYFERIEEFGMIKINLKEYAC